MTATLHCSASHSEDHSVARRQKPVVTMETRLMWKVERVVSRRQQGRLSRWALQPLLCPSMEAPLSFQRWDLGSRQQMPSDKGQRGARKMGYSELCSCKPRALVEEVAPEMGLRADSPSGKPHTHCFPQIGLSAETKPG